MNKKTINFQILKVNRFHYTRYTRIRLISKKCTQNTKKRIYLMKQKVILLIVIFLTKLNQSMY